MPKFNDLVLGRLSYLSPSGGRYKGRLRITKSELLFESTFDASFEILNKTAIKKKDGRKYYCMQKEDISSVEFKSNLLSKQILLSLNGKVHIFRTRKLSENQIYNALKS